MFVFSNFALSENQIFTFCYKESELQKQTQNNIKKTHDKT